MTAMMMNERISRCCSSPCAVLVAALLFAGLFFLEPLTRQALKHSEQGGVIFVGLSEQQNSLRLPSTPPCRKSKAPLTPRPSLAGPSPSPTDIDDHPAAREGSPVASPVASPASAGAERRSAATAFSPAPLTSETVRSPRSSDRLTSLERVELELDRARAAIGRVAVSQMASAKGDHDAGGNGTAVDPDGEPAGDIYLNAALFRRSYREMERRFKIYVYEEGDEPLAHTGPCTSIYAVEGRFIQELQAGNPFVTSDPERAHAFFLPISVVMMVSYLYEPGSPHRLPVRRFVEEYVRILSRTHSYWTRSAAADHFMLSCHDWGPYASGADHNLFATAIRVLCNANVTEGFVPAKDASLPEINLVGGHILGGLGGLPAANRTSLAFFAGRDHGPVRPALFQHWEGKESGEEGTNIHVFHQLPAEGKSYHEYMKSSKYCLCPGGYEVNSPRIVEAIYNECVPVVIADAFVLPFSDVLDWEKFSVRVAERDIPNLRTILEAIPPASYLEMQARLRQVQRHFVLNQPPTRFDAFHMILHSVWLRRLNVRILSD